MQKQKYAFTLVELIVVITILAILGTIAFISLSGYSEQARDSTRISDIGSIKTSLELFQLDAGKYPQPTTGVNITYSGAIVWNQGTFGETVFSNVSKLDKIPTDPLTNSKYTYSVIQNKSEYELAGIIEGDVISMENIPPLTPPYQGWGLVQQTNAGEIIATAYTTGNYNGQMAKSLSGVICDMLAIPTIIASDLETSTDLVQITNNKKLVFSGYKNLPNSFKSSKFNINGGFDFQIMKLQAYTDSNSCTDLTDYSDYSARVELLKGLQDAYSGTTIKDIGEIKNILSLNIDVNNPSSDVVKYAGNFVNTKLGGKVSLDYNGSIAKISTSLNGNGTITVNDYVTTNNYTLNQTDVAYLAKSIMANNTCNTSGSVVSYLTSQGYTYNNGNIQFITPASSVTGTCNFNGSTNTITQCMTAGGVGIVSSLWAGNDPWPSGSYYHMVNNGGGNSGYWVPAGGVYLGVLPQGSTLNLTPAQIYTAISTWLTTADLNYFLTDCSTGNPYSFISAYNSDGSLYVSHPTYGTGIISKDNIGTITKNIYSSGTCLGATSVINVLSSNNYSTSTGEITNLPSNTWGDCGVNPDNVSLSQCIEQLKVYYSTQNVVARQEVGTAYVLANPWLYNLGPTTNSSFSWWVGYSNPGINPDGGALSNSEIYSVINNWLKTANLNYYLNNCSTGELYTSISGLLSY